jgi:hypothetical protein
LVLPMCGHGLRPRFEARGPRHPVQHREDSLLFFDQVEFRGSAFIEIVPRKAGPFIH